MRDARVHDPNTRLEFSHSDLLSIGTTNKKTLAHNFRMFPYVGAYIGASFNSYSADSVIISATLNGPFN